jgi:protocatechuate 3,4-dioxygenase beta subunit
MRRALEFALLLAIPLVCFSAPQQLGTSTGSIAGIVVRADTDQPIAPAQVTLTAQAPDTPAPGPAAIARGAITSVTTGADGKFAFENLNPGSYRVVATATGFGRQEYGQRATYGPGRLVFVVAGRSFGDTKIRMTPAGVVAGRILDESGQPAVGAPVQLWRVTINLQGKAYQPVGGGSVDDRGNFRISDVPPGRYYLMAGAQAAAVGLAMGLRGGAVPDIYRYAAVFHPNVSNIDDATTIEVAGGKESSFDMRLERTPRKFHIRGRVINPGGATFPPDTIVTVGFRSLAGAGSAVSPNSFDPATGTFDVPNVPRGEFTINVVPSPQPPRGAGGVTIPEQRARSLAASVPVSVSNADIDGLVLTLAAGVTVGGRLTVQGRPLSALPDLGSVRLILNTVPMFSPLGNPLPSTIADDGTFQVVGMREGEYRAQLNANVPGFYVRNIKFGGEEVLGKTFRFRSGDSGSFEVVLQAGMQTLSGTVTDSEPQPVSGIAVFLIPSDRARLDLFRNTITDQNGKFSFANIAPGDYKVFSWEAADNNAHLDPDFLKPYEGFGKAVSVAESSNTSLDVKLIPAQQAK